MLEEVSSQSSGGASSTVRASRPDTRLVTVGSIIRLTRDGDVVWGTGVNGKSKDLPFERRVLDIRSVRGPRTRAWLMSKGFVVPEIFGDPGLLTARYAASIPAWEKSCNDVLVVPNLHDYVGFKKAYEAEFEVLNPQSPLEECIARIRAANFVAGSSLHGVCLADAFGVPARLISPGTEPAFKYEDYFLGTGRSVPRVARSVGEALSYGGAPSPDFDAERLRAAFPYELWECEPG
ncbi:polysaccharide pyruvyl transferase family protein [Gordonia alkanivorans]|nr:polysaccharide pyruvyl transferase family protein [Gordonia alkanivorans]MDH3046687.1 polysaccharide pyruvyl transferase family protein [Gordonia alkanivorans]MDJ0010341.1 polysaccharide pyruvyl transferase family protein [Gordonia alkanivorans]MDJ0100112.1 polysaccharide pyruvyl transferase family protein [Gordonia alkanivorans]MDJ0495977.1 polysaccharide pyruvyl transferase family protein [Gordonia alkanivorans]